MEIRAVQSSSASRQQVSANNPFAKVQQDFKNIGSALESGNLEDAKKAFAQLKADAPNRGNNDDPLSAQIDALGKALDSGDLQSAQDAFAKIQETLAQKRPAGGGGGPSGGGGSKSSTSYDVRDTNQDGTVSAQEQYIYDLTQAVAKLSQSPQSASTAATDAVALQASSTDAQKSGSLPSDIYNLFGNQNGTNAQLGILLDAKA